MNELLTTLDEAVFTPELTKKIQDLYESKIQDVMTEADAKVQEANTAMVEALEKLALVEETSAKEIEDAKALYESKGEEYTKYIAEAYEEKVTAYTEYMKEEMSKDLDAYLNIVAEEFIEQNKIAIDESAKLAKVNAILEGFDSLMISTGVELSSIVEAKKPESDKAEIKSMQKALDKVIAENAELKAEKEALIKESIIEKLTANMSIVQKDRFSKLAEMVVYSDSFEDKLNTIAEAVSKKVEEVATVITEDVKPPVTNVKADHKRYF